MHRGAADLVPLAAPLHLPSCLPALPGTCTAAWHCLAAAWTCCLVAGALIQVARWPGLALPLGTAAWSSRRRRQVPQRAARCRDPCLLQLGVLNQQQPPPRCAELGIEAAPLTDCVTVQPQLFRTMVDCVASHSAEVPGMQLAAQPAASPASTRGARRSGCTSTTCGSCWGCGRAHRQQWCWWRPASSQSGCDCCGGQPDCRTACCRRRRTVCCTSRRRPAGSAGAAAPGSAVCSSHGSGRPASEPAGS